MAIPAMALLQQHDARRDIVTEPPAWRRAAIEARGHSELGAFVTGGAIGRKNPPVCLSVCHLSVCRYNKYVCVRRKSLPSRKSRVESVTRRMSTATVQPSTQSTIQSVNTYLLQQHQWSRCRQASTCHC